MGNLRTLLNSWIPGWLKGNWGTRHFGVLGLFADAISQGASESVKAPWLKESTSPNDALALKGRERLLERYPNETNDQYRSRINDAWKAWSDAGGSPSIEGQLHAAGFTDAYVAFDSGREGPRGLPAPYWSQFWVRFPPESGIVVSLTQHLWDGASALWDGAISWQPTNLTKEQLSLLAGIINKWKPSDWICRGLIFDFSSEFWDGSKLWDGSTQWAGAFELDLT